jgi:hypothetical protein
MKGRSAGLTPATLSQTPSPRVSSKRAIRSRVSTSESARRCRNFGIDKEQPRDFSRASERGLLLFDKESLQRDGVRVLERGGGVR